LQRQTQFKLWAGHDPRPGLGYRVIAREVIPAGSFVFEYAGDYLPVSWQHVVSNLPLVVAACDDTRSSPDLQSGSALSPALECNSDVMLFDTLNEIQTRNYAMLD
jgi:hypothetical protein